MALSPVRLKLSPDERGAEGLYGIALTACLLAVMSLLEPSGTYVQPNLQVSRLPLLGTCRASIDNLRNANYNRLLPGCLLAASDLSLPTDTGHSHGVSFCCLSYPPLHRQGQHQAKVPTYLASHLYPSSHASPPHSGPSITPALHCTGGALCLSLPHPSDTLPRLCLLRPRPRSLDPRFTHLLRYNNTPCDGLLVWAPSPPPLCLF